MYKFIKHEWKYWLTSPMIWIFLFINALLVFAAVSSENVTIGGGVGNVLKNSPYVVQQYYGVFSLLCLLMTTAFMNASAIRDFQHGMYQFVFSSPIKKSHYYFGKFIGAVTISVIPLLGVSLGALLGPLMPWVEPERYGPVVWSGHVQGLLAFGIPNTFIAGVLLYALAMIFRSSIVSFVGAMLLLVLYAVSSGYTQDIEKEWLANLLDPFGFRPESIASKYLTVAEKNAAGVPLQGAFLLNRLIWIGIAFLILLATYARFSFSIRNEKSSNKSKQKKKEEAPMITERLYEPSAHKGLRLGAFFHLFGFELRALIKNPTFITIVAIGLINLIAALATYTGRYGTDQYPVTYDMVNTIQGSFFLFNIAIITFYTGVLVWKERDAKINEIEDATPSGSHLMLLSKVLALITSLAIVNMLSILVCIIAQTVMGYFRYQVDVYVISLLVNDLLTYVYYTIAALLFHYLINNRYIAYFAFVAFLIINTFVFGLLEINSNMLKYGSVPTSIFSDMNGFGPYRKGLFWFNAYWFFFASLLCFIVYLFYVRGKETQFVKRLAEAAHRLAAQRGIAAFLLIACVACGGFVYYNTQVLNTYESPKESEQMQADYETKYKKYEQLAQPRFLSYEYNIDLQPSQRNLHAVIKAWAKNNTPSTISELHFTMPSLRDSVIIRIKNSKETLRDKRLGYRIFALSQALKPQDSVLIEVEVWGLTKGFENEVSFTQLTENGTFFNNRDIMPTLGYNNGYEIADKNKRVKRKLPKRLRSPKLNENNAEARRNNYLTNDADWVDVHTVISTDTDQIAVAPGSLEKEWVENGRRYFSYRLDKKSLDFYSFISARYEVSRKKWNGIDLEVYYIKEHAYNVPNMQKSMEKALAYYTKNFGSYFHKQCRIIEFPRYQSFAQAFPGTMPYSESIGFIMDLRNVTADDIDQVFYVVAHEMGHQYWAHQVCGAEMQGSELMSEGFAQYSALMVMEKEYGKDKMKKFLKYEMDGYLNGRGSELEAERPIYKTEGQQYIHYQKASVVLYYLKEMIGEQNVNLALKSLIDSFAYNGPPYPTSLSAVRAFRRVTPDTLQYLIDDMFEHITLFNNRVVNATYRQVNKKYEVTLNTLSEKFRSDSVGKETPVTLSDYVDVAIFAEPTNTKNLGKVLVKKRIRVTNKDNTFTFITSEKPYRAGIDPYNYLIDRIPDDNVKKINSSE